MAAVAPCLVAAEAGAEGECPLGMEGVGWGPLGLTQVVLQGHQSLSSAGGGGQSHEEIIKDITPYTGLYTLPLCTTVKSASLVFSKLLKVAELFN